MMYSEILKQRQRRKENLKKELEKARFLTQEQIQTIINELEKIYKNIHLEIDSHINPEIPNENELEILVTNNIDEFAKYITFIQFDGFEYSGLEASYDKNIAIEVLYGNNIQIGNVNKYEFYDIGNLISKKYSETAPNFNTTEDYVVLNIIHSFDNCNGNYIDEYKHKLIIYSPDNK